MDVIPETAEWRDQLVRDVRAGLTAHPKILPPKYFYDAAGSDLFDRITRLPEYYPTRREREILQARASTIARLTGAETLIELGSGTSEKTRLLLHALTTEGSLRRFVPFDVDPAVLATAGPAIADEFPTLAVDPIVGDFEQDLGLLPTGPHRLLAFLGSTIGNLDRGQRADFLQTIRSVLGRGDALLLGTDLVKPVDRLLAAYDDRAGLTAAFNKNVLAVLNRELGADFDPAAFEHRAVWDADNQWVEMRLRSRREQTVRIRDLELAVPFGVGEELRTEISAKFTRRRVSDELRTAGFRLEHWWTDPAGDFALSLSIPD